MASKKKFIEQERRSESRLASHEISQPRVLLQLMASVVDAEVVEHNSGGTDEPAEKPGPGVIPQVEARDVGHPCASQSQGDSRPSHDRAAAERRGGESRRC